MKKSHSKLRKVIPLALSLVAGGAGIASADELDSVLNTTTMDFMFVGDYLHKINRNEITDINALIKGGNVKRIYAISPQDAIKREIAYLNTKEGREFYAGQGKRLTEQGFDLAVRFNNFLRELDKAKVAPSAKSLESLTSALTDGKIEPKELSDVSDGLYAFVKEGYDKEKGNYAVFYLMKLTSDKTPSQYEAEFNKLQNDYNDLVKKESELEKKAQAPVQPQIQKSETPKQEKDYRGVWLQAQQTANGDLNSYITSIGARVNPFKDLDIGFGANLDIGFGMDKQTDSYTAPLSAGRTASGTITDTNKFSIGGSLEAQFGPFVLGGGIDYKISTQEIVEKILNQYGDVLKSNINSVPNRQIFGKGYGGVEIPLGEGVKLGMLIGYNGKDGAYFGLRGGVKIK